MFVVINRCDQQIIYLDLLEASFLDRLNRLEQLNIIDNKEKWLNLMNMRNKLAHEYEDDAKGMSEVLNLVYESYSELVGIFVHVRTYLVSKLEEKNPSD